MPITLDAVAETSYASCGDLSLAYQVFGDGPVELVWAGSFASHVELYWTMPEFGSLMEKLGTFARILLFDKAGVGLSDPVPRVRTLDERAAEIEAVMDAAGFGKAALIGVSEGGPAAILFAATRPERTRALILTGTTSYSATQGWDDLECDPAELRARVVRELGEDYVPSLEWIARSQEFGRAIRSAWGSGAALKCVISSIRSMRQLGTLERMCASPAMARATAEAGFRIDVRPILPTITVPTLVLHARDDPGVPVQSGRYLADHIPGARLVELEGADHAPWFTEPDRVATEIEELLTGSHTAPAQSHRALRTVLFTDIVASTEHAAAMGDERWRAVLQRFGEITAELTERFGGTVVKSTGDGHLTTFDGPTQAIRCAEALRAGAETLGIEIRIGIHTGECELLDCDIGGLRYTSRRGSSGTQRRAISWSPARSVTWSSVPAPASRTVAAWSCAAFPALGNSWRSSVTARGPDRPRRNWCQCPPRPSLHDAPVGSRSGGDGEADTVDIARDGPVLRGHRSKIAELR
ncbi:cyclase [Mycobacterium kansasii]|uniref:Cyclase n=1 Tax=Mycobacterium kansasii TaxID=1768 RepID=A0A7G1I5G7_MYCKA|nr:cyclase [Mycobacterium kansasii]